jgi:hypothetical protein
MAITDNLNPPPTPQRVFYSTGRMLAAQDFQADQDYHRSRLARVLTQLYGTGTVSGLKVVRQVWQPKTAYPQFSFVYDPSNNVQVNTGTAGTSGSNPPAFDAAAGGTATDSNGIVWTNEGKITPGGWKPSTVFSFPTTIVDPNNNIQSMNIKPNITSAATPPVFNTTIGATTGDGGKPAWICAGPAFEIAVTPGVAIDRVGRLIEVPRQVCIILSDWLNQQITAWQNSVAHPVPGQTSLPNPNHAVHNGNLVVDVFATFVPCTRGLTPCFSAEDDYDATDAFSANRLLDSFAMQLVLRTDGTPTTVPPTPQDPWKSIGALPDAGTGLTTANETTLQNLLLEATAGPVTAAVEYLDGFDTSSVFLARILFPAAAGAGSNGPTYDLTKLSIDNNSRLFLYPAGLVARLAGLGSGSET